MQDNFNNEGLGIEVDFLFLAGRAVRSLNQIIEWRGKPLAIKAELSVIALIGPRPMSAGIGGITPVPKMTMVA